MFSSYFKTFRSLFNEPRNVIDGFVHGDGERFMHPFKFLMIGLIIVLILNSALVDFSFEPTAQATAGVDEENEQLVEIAEWIEVSNVRLSTQFLPVSLMLLFIPMLALGGMIFLRNQTDGFYHNLMINAYAVAAAFPVLLILIPAWILLPAPLTDPFMNSTMPAVLIAGVVIWICNSYLRPDGIMEWIRLISSYATGYIFYIIISGFAAGVVGYLFFVVNRIMELSGS
ncbi:MAG: DUF3667 domain-containing protein [Balneolaceae bacterium]|nr:DUF3667 domain-containing protein [Balneolaceae bacterium]MCH8549643.1 DUF3667 domain-containing protein [Balneolaceae bacterium]